MRAGCGVHYEPYSEELYARDAGLVILNGTILGKAVQVDSPISLTLG